MYPPCPPSLPDSTLFPPLAGLVEPLALSMDEESDEDLQTLEQAGRGAGAPGPRRFAALRSVWGQQSS